MSMTPVRLAVWSGPRNISTAMMRSWGNRDDCFVCDEPLYSHYLDFTQKDHPGKEEVITAGEPDWRKVVAWLSGPVPKGKRVFFQKHMTHHLLPHIDRAWLELVRNVFLIRHPRDVLRSYIKIVADPNAEDTGFPQQLELFNWIRQRLGMFPLVLDAQDVQNQPRKILGSLCDALGLEFQDSMLSWTPGLRASDGVWAKHWYREVETSTEFRPYHPREGELPVSLQSLCEECLASYETMHKQRLH